jgi:broad specificity phosphatase PhoE
LTVTLMRHFKVVFTWKARYTPAAFAKAQDEYDEADIVDQGVRLDGGFQRVITSSRKRTAKTLEYALGPREHRETELLDEVPMDPCTDRERPYSTAWLTAVSRLQWFFNSRRQAQNRRVSRERARRFIREYLAEEADYLVVGHRFNFRVLSRELRRCGFKGKAITLIRNGECFTYRRTAPLSPR